MRGGNVGQGTEERRHRVTRDRAQAGTRDPMAINNSPMVPDADCQCDKTAFRGSKDNKEIILTYAKDTVYRNVDVIWSCRQMRRP